MRIFDYIQYKNRGASSYVPCKYIKCYLGSKACQCCDYFAGANHQTKRFSCIAPFGIDPESVKTSKSYMSRGRKMKVNLKLWSKVYVVLLRPNKRSIS